MDRIISCEFNIDTACVEVKYADGSMISIDCTRVENEVARNMYEASELDWLVYNAPVDYVNLLLNGDMREYLRNVTDFRQLKVNTPLKSIRGVFFRIQIYYGLQRFDNQLFLDVNMCFANHLSDRRKPNYDTFPGHRDYCVFAV